MYIVYGNSSFPGRPGCGGGVAQKPSAASPHDDNDCKSIVIVVIAIVVVIVVMEIIEYFHLLYEL